MPRIFLSHSSIDGRQATALKRWLVQHDPSLERQIFLDTDIKTGMKGGEQWTVTLHRNLASCQALLCLISKNWEASKERHHEYRGAEDRGKTIFCARLEPDAGLALISQFERRDLYVESGQPVTTIELDDGGPPVDFSTDGLERLLTSAHRISGRTPSPGRPPTSTAWAPSGLRPLRPQTPLCTLAGMAS